MSRFWILVVGALAVGCEDDTCDPDNHPLETSECACEVDEDCSCRVFTGAEFVEGEASPSFCLEDGTCDRCMYE